MKTRARRVFDSGDGRQTGEFQRTTVSLSEASHKWIRAFGLPLMHKVFFWLSRNDVFVDTLGSAFA